jgi:hypothetical protein
MLKFITGKFRMILMGIAVVAGPVIYAFGIMGGKRKAEIASLESENNRQKAITDFYREMEGYDAESDHPRNRADLVERLRSGDF